ncbi:hypothetical protein AKJ16_DCAP04031 [Drosera capensis]
MKQHNHSQADLTPFVHQFQFFPSIKGKERKKERTTLQGYKSTMVKSAQDIEEIDVNISIAETLS